MAPSVPTDEHLYLVASDVDAGLVRAIGSGDGTRRFAFPLGEPNAELRWLLGVDERGWAYAGGKGVLVVDPDAAGGSAVPWHAEDLLEESVARGWLGGRFVYLPGRKAGGDEILLRLDRETGKVVEEIVHPGGGGHAFGNLLAIPGEAPALVSVGPTEIFVLEGRRP